MTPLRYLAMLAALSGCRSEAPVEAAHPQTEQTMSAGVQSSSRTVGALKLEVDRLAGEHRPPGVAPASADAAWSPAEASVALELKDGAVTVRARWQYDGAAVKDAEFEVDAPPSASGRVRVLLVPLMGTGKGADGAVLARVRWVIEADLDDARATGTIVRRLLIDGAGGSTEDRDG